ncbi:hypothetical protein [Gimesia alba]|uniref:hypothetical protein n=1 Tax=Gimesia alba TaxID=2527973 RepID=UPI0018D80F3E|nr:hypothetical protein [Gimesia alba]
MFVVHYLLAPIAERSLINVSVSITELYVQLKHRLDQPLPPLDYAQFKPPTTGKGQQWLF